LCLRQNPAAHRYVARLASKHGKPKALTILAHKLARALYHMLHRAHAFDADQFVHGTGPVAPALRSEVTAGPPLGPESDPARRKGKVQRPADHATATAEVVMATTLAD
jgi:hypothetical protein